MEVARAIYRQRRTGLATALAHRGMAVPEAEGLDVWLPVASEPCTMVTLAARGIVIHPGAKFSTGGTNSIRIATSMSTDRIEDVADACAVRCSCRS